MTEETKEMRDLFVEGGLAKPYGNVTNRHLSAETLLKTISETEKRRYDVVTTRNNMLATEGVPGTGHAGFGVTFEGSDALYRPTNTALRQMAEQAKIPVEFLRNNVAKYPGLAADMMNTWLRDIEVLNRVGTTRERKQQVAAHSMKHLFRLLKPNGSGGVLRAMLSSRYMILDTSDTIGVMLEEMQASKREFQVTGSLSDERMYLRIKMVGVEAEITFPGKGKGHERIHVPCGASLLMSGSDVGLGSVVFEPELEVYTCTNLLRTTERLAQVHIGREYTDLGILSEDTIRKTNMAVMGRIRDTIRTVTTPDNFHKLANAFSEFAGGSVPEPSKVVENVTAKFILPSEMGKSILDRFIEEGLNNRFGLAQAITFQAHAVREHDFPMAVALEDIGSKVLRMPEKTFQEELVA